MESLPVDITSETPLRLKDAARIAFPGGSIGVSSLRREIARGRLACTVIAGKQFTTLKAVREMIELCRVDPKAPACGLSQKSATGKGNLFGTQHGSSATDRAKSARAALRMTAKGPKKH